MVRNLGNGTEHRNIYFCGTELGIQFYVDWITNESTVVYNTDTARPSSLDPVYIVVYFLDIQYYIWYRIFSTRGGGSGCGWNRRVGRGTCRSAAVH